MLHKSVSPNTRSCLHQSWLVEPLLLFGDGVRNCIITARTIFKNNQKQSPKFIGKNSRSSQCLTLLLRHSLDLYTRLKELENSFLPPGLQSRIAFLLGQNFSSLAMIRKARVALSLPRGLWTFKGCCWLGMMQPALSYTSRSRGLNRMLNGWNILGRCSKESGRFIRRVWKQTAGNDFRLHDSLRWAHVTT